MYPIVFSSNPMAQYDIDQYRRFLDSKGGSLGDETLGESEALERLKAFVIQHYALAGRIDFTAFQTAYQVGSGTKAYSFLGKEWRLLNSPAWTAAGITCGATNQYLECTDLPPGKPMPYWIAYSGRVNTYVPNAYLFDINNGGGYAIGGMAQINNNQLFTGIRTDDNSAWSSASWRPPYTVGTFHFISTGYGADLHMAQVDHTFYSRTATSTASLGAKICINNRPDTLLQGGRSTARFVMVADTQPSGALFTNAMTIYNATLGLN